MGREATCPCEHGGETGEVKALLEYGELILRGSISRRIPFATMEQIKASGSRLSFRCKGESFSLALGSELAAKWAAIIATPPPSLAKKMGITSEISVELAGETDDKALEGALAEAKSIARRNGDLIVTCVDTPEALARVLKSKSASLANGTPMWVVYPKGRGHAITESDVRELCLAAGIVDHKVAAVSSTLTALRFVKQKTRS